MSFVLRGPWPSNSKLIVLPSPATANTQALKSSVQTMRMMDGSARTFIKPRRGRKSYRWDFLVGVGKATELENYVIENSGQPCMVTWRGLQAVGWLTLNPLEMGGEPGEMYRVTLEFEEKK